MSQAQNPHQSPSPLEFNPFDPSFTANPHPTMQRMREEAPVFFWEPANAWLLTRHEDVMTVLRDEQRFTANQDAWELAPMMKAMRGPAMEMLHKHGFFALDNQNHTRVRKLVSPAFTPRAIERLRPEVQRIVDEALAAHRGDTFDIAREYAEPIPVRVISTMLNIPASRDVAFHRFADILIRAFVPGSIQPDEMEQVNAAVAQGVALVNEIIEERRRNPMPNDMLTALIQAEEQGDKLSKEELIALVGGLLVAGSETTVHMIAFTLYHLLKSPELLAQVKADPERIKSLIDEVLRYDSFGKLGTPRFATEDVVLRGQTIRKGQMVMLMFGSALRDEAAYPHADKLDLSRDNTASLAFGSGAHYCLGVHLAKLEGQVAISTLLRRFPNMRLEGEPVYGDHPAIRKMVSLKISLRPEPKA